VSTIRRTQLLEVAAALRFARPASAVIVSTKAVAKAAWTIERAIWVLAIACPSSYAELATLVADRLHSHLSQRIILEEVQIGKAKGTLLLGQADL